jgi:hypothetical protein
MRRRRSVDRSFAWSMGALIVTGVLVVTVAAASLGVAGCGSDGATSPTEQVTTNETMETTTSTPATSSSLSTTTTSPPDTSTTSTAPAGTTTTEALSSAETLLPNGHIRAMGYIDQIRFDGVTNFLRIDYAEMLTGDEANAAAVEAGEIEPGDSVPNDYFIRNTNPQRREFKVSDSVAITTSTWGGVMERPITWEEFRSFWSLSPPADGMHLRDMPWWIDRDGDTVVKIDEQYLP